MNVVEATGTDAELALDLVDDLKEELSEERDLPPDGGSFADFYTSILSWDLPEFQRAGVVPALQDHEEHPRVLVLAPPGHAKTTLLCAYAAWRLGLDPDIRIIVATHTTTYSILLLRFVEDILASPRYVEIFDDLIPEQGSYRWTASEKFVERSSWKSPHPSLTALGVGSSTIGYRADLLLTDDLVTQQNSMTATQRGHLSNWYYGSLVKRLEPGGEIFAIGARFYAQDLYGALLDSYESFVFKSTPEDPLWPERFGPEALTEAREENYHTYCAQYRQEPIDLESSFLKESDLEYYVEEPEEMTVFQGVDFAIKEESDAREPAEPNHFAEVTVGITFDGVAHLLDVTKAHASRTQQKAYVVNNAEKWNPTMINVETDAAQKFLFDELVEETSLPLNSVTSESIPKTMRIAGMATHFRNEKALLPGRLQVSGRIVPSPRVNDFLEEWRNYPGGGDDVLDATRQALRAAFGEDREPATGTADRVQDERRVLPVEVFERERESAIFARSTP